MSAPFAAGPFGDQVNSDAFTQNFFYIMSSTAVVLGLLGLVLIDAGLVRRNNVLSTAVQKLVAFSVGTAAYMVAGFALWNYQYNKAFGVKNGFMQALKDWWFGGNFLSDYAQKIDPAVAPSVGNSQIFFVFLAVYGGFVCALVHTAASERIRSAPLYAISAVIGGVIYPVVLWLTWGSTSPLTNAGTHDFVGAYSSYIFAGAFGLVLTVKLKPRLGLFPKPGEAATLVPHNVPMALLGVVVLLFAAPLIVMGCGFFVPEDGYYGISMTTSGLGSVYINVFVSFVVGGIVGGILAYATRNPVHAILGPVAGYVANTTGFDVFKPWETMIVAVVGPLVVALVCTWVNKRGIDDAKVLPLACAAVAGDVLVGLLAWGTPTGGYFGLKGDYGFQHAEINLWWQLAGTAVTVAIGLVSAVVLLGILGSFMKLRVSAEDELNGIDAARWSPRQRPQAHVRSDAVAT
ncbi:ammonium transporter [Spirillospora sp. CA-255316]